MKQLYPVKRGRTDFNGYHIKGGHEPVKSVKDNGIRRYNLKILCPLIVTLL